MIDHDIDAGPCSQGRVQIQAFPTKCLDESLYFNVLTSCPKNELRQWFIGLYGEYIMLAIVHRYTQGIAQGQPCLRDQRLAVERRPQPRVGGLLVAKTKLFRRKSRSQSEAARRAWETRNAWKQPAASEEEESS
jgi:hypothetical protein